jgi:hypothetical protein
LRSRQDLERANSLLAPGFCSQVNLLAHVGGNGSARLLEQRLLEQPVCPTFPVPAGGDQRDPRPMLPSSLPEQGHSCIGGVVRAEPVPEMARYFSTIAAAYWSTAITEEKGPL